MAYAARSLRDLAKLDGSSSAGARSTFGPSAASCPCGTCSRAAFAARGTGSASRRAGGHRDPEHPVDGQDRRARQRSLRAPGPAVREDRHHHRAACPGSGDPPGPARSGRRTWMPTTSCSAGLDLLYRLRRSEFDRAREMFDKSIALDPGYAAPYALNALWHSIRVGQGWSEDPARRPWAVDRFAEAALERDPFDARALALCGHMRALLFHDYEGAFALFDRAIAVSPNSAAAWGRSSPTYSYVGDAAEAKRRAADRPAAVAVRPPSLLRPHRPRPRVLHGRRLRRGRGVGAGGPSRRIRTTRPILRFLAASLAAAGRPAEAQPHRTRAARHRARISRPALL